MQKDVLVDFGDQGKGRIIEVEVELIDEYFVEGTSFRGHGKDFPFPLMLFLLLTNLSIGRQIESFKVLCFDYYVYVFKINQKAKAAAVSDANSLELVGRLSELSSDFPAWCCSITSEIPRTIPTSILLV